MSTAKELKEAIEKGAEIIEDEYGGTGLEVLKHAAILRAHLATIDEERALLEAADLRRNTIIHDDPKFEGRWVAVPEEDFNRLRSIREAIVAKRKEGG